MVPTGNECESAGATKSSPRDPGTISAGLMAAQAGSGPALYLSGSDGDDNVVASYAGGQVSFTVGGSPAGSLPAPRGARLGCSSPASPAKTRLCAVGFPETTSVVLLGGEGGDELTGGATEDAVIDGAGDDVVSAGGGDDAVPNNGGADDLDAGPGEDLFISNSVCDGDSLEGGPDRDNANWANFGSAVAIDMATSGAGLVGGGGQPSCAERGADHPRRDRGHRGNEPRRRHGRRRRARTSCSAGRAPTPTTPATATTRSSPTPAPRAPTPTRRSIAAQGSTPPRSTGPRTAPTRPRSIARPSRSAIRTASARPTRRPIPTPEAAATAVGPQPPPRPRDRTPPATRILHRPAKARRARAPGGARSSSRSARASPAPASAAGSTAGRSPPAARRAPTRSGSGPTRSASSRSMPPATATGPPAGFRFRVRRR